ncbi:MAG: hypothetical protein UY03_C0010G0023 [Parcubacteria group bacterium GW2011_GWA2_47_64]|nr:MAG: hypothetical protein UY03_C0010G0023 [Parcubacteria group bacterium GW2011_GWA2_47_64]KKU97153.1 MAG: hypothetical protein UY29_C0002G0050 [Parcubacteria group bacterium GW2011_GWC2_48_17]
MGFSFDLNLIALPHLLVAVFLLAQGILVIAQNPNSGLNRSFFVFELAAFVWLFGMGLNYLSANYETATFFSRIGFLGVLYIPVTTYLFSVYYLGDDRQKNAAFLGIIATFLFSLFIGTEYMASGVYEYAWGYYIELGPLGIGGVLLFLIFAPLFIRNFYLKYKDTSKRYAHQGRWGYFAFITGALAFLAVTDFLPGFGISIGVPPVGFLFVGGLATLMGYFILRYRLVDIELVAGRSVGHFVMTAILLLGYGSIFVILSPFETTYEHLGFDTLLFIIALYLLAPLKEWSQRIVDELFAKERLNLDRAVSLFTAELRNLSDIATLTNNLLIFLSEKLRIESSAVYLLEENEKQWVFFQSVSVGAAAHHHRDTNIGSFVAKFPSARVRIFDARGFTDPVLSKHPLVSEVLSIIRERGEIIAFPLVLRGVLLGFFSLGRRLSKKDFAGEELVAFERLAGSVAIALENARTFEALQLSSRSKNDFITIVSHQLRTPLTNIKWVTEALLADAKAMSPDARPLLERASKSVEAMVNLISQLLDTVSNSKAVFGELVTTPKKLLLILEEIAEEYQSIMGRKGITLTKLLPREFTWTVRSSPIYLRAILSVLLDNASRYTPKGGTVHLEISLSDEAHLQFSVIDNGIGIPDGEQPRVFEKFFRANNALSLVPDGTGLGLFYAKQLVSAQGGEMWFRSKEGQGTSVFFSLPLNDGKGKE